MPFSFLAYLVVRTFDSLLSDCAVVLTVRSSCFAHARICTCYGCHESGSVGQLPQVCVPELLSPTRPCPRLAGSPLQRTMRSCTGAHDSSSLTRSSSSALERPQVLLHRGVPRALSQKSDGRVMRMLKDSWFGNLAIRTLPSTDSCL